MDQAEIEGQADESLEKGNETAQSAQTEGVPGGLQKDQDGIMAQLGL